MPTGGGGSSKDSSSGISPRQPSNPGAQIQDAPSPLPRSTGAPSSANHISEERAPSKAKNHANTEEAAKMCKYAQSALMFEDTDAAIQYLEKALSILKS